MAIILYVNYLRQGLQVGVVGYGRYSNLEYEVCLQ